MAKKGIHVGVNAGYDPVARKVKGLYVGVNGVAKKVKKGYVGVGGVAKSFFGEYIWVKYRVEDDVDTISLDIMTQYLLFPRYKIDINKTIAIGEGLRPTMLSADHLGYYYMDDDGTVYRLDSLTDTTIIGIACKVVDYGTVVSDSESAYPDDWLHTDGYYYIRVS